jgi:hypothetical protein
MVLLGLALTFSPDYSAAQRHSKFGAGAGIGTPVGEFADEVDLGWLVHGFASVPIHGTSLDARFDIAYMRLGSAFVGNPSMVPILVGLAYGFESRGSTRPYLLAGTGAYYLKTESPTFSDNKLGVNWGIGLPWQRLFFEGRFHYVFDRADTFLTLTVGF